MYELHKKTARETKEYKKKSYQYIHRVGQEPFCNISLFVYMESLEFLTSLKTGNLTKSFFCRFNCFSTLIRTFLTLLGIQTLRGRENSCTC